MAIRWKSRIRLVACIILFTFGLNGIIYGLDYGGNFFKKDYFHTQQFDYELEQFIDYLSMFELNYTSKEEAKKRINVTAEEIDEHRYRYGNLPEQIADIKNQYEYKILEAQEANSQEIVNMYIAERDEKIEDITNNFKSDEHVRVKIVKEKEAQLDNYYRELENHRQDFLRYKSHFSYYLKDTSTGEVFTNLALDIDNPTAVFSNKNDWFYVANFSAGKQGFLSTEGRYFSHSNYDLKISSYRYHDEVTFEVGRIFANNTAGMFEGQIGVSTSLPAASPLMIAYHDYQFKQIVFFSYTLSALIALLLSMYLNKKEPVLKALSVQRWESYYNRLPLDLRVSAFAVIALMTLIGLTSSLPLYHSASMFMKLIDILIHLLVTSFLLLLTLIQAKYLVARLKDKRNLQEEWSNTLLYKAYQALKDAFLNRKIGTQLVLLLAVVFAFGAGAMLVLIEPEPEVFLVYTSLFLLIGLPTLFFLLRRTGYFNQIISYTNELAQGNLEPDLPVLGKSVLATLTTNINSLKHGVKVSQKEQVKSERLKTELITNVSHDLRTPLTSIITYTELLKTADVTDEDRQAYLQIIDRKSQRLKVLIDDLFEASKMASGSIELVKEKVDLVQLLQQALAEHNETIGESSLSFRLTNTEKPVYAIVDGQKIWRVFDNLIGNILKYSLENTRVYISLQATTDKAIITFKNIAKYELGGNIDEMFERFKRGDTSRHTEGSGLGLAIAKSIVDLHDGSLDIELDGDLFKVTVVLDRIK